MVWHFFISNSQLIKWIIVIIEQILSMQKSLNIYLIYAIILSRTLLFQKKISRIFWIINLIKNPFDTYLKTKSYFLITICKFYWLISYLIIVIILKNVIIQELRYQIIYHIYSTKYISEYYYHFDIQYYVIQKYLI